MKTMRLIIPVLVLAFLSLPIPPPGYQGGYNPISGLYSCSTRVSCIHEIGHKVDQESGWISHSKEFGFAVQVYVQVEYGLTAIEPGHPSSLARDLIVFPGVYTWNGYLSDTQTEIYAYILQKADGKEQGVPAAFRRFYHWDRIRELLR